MRKHVVAASLGALAVAGLAWAASGSGLTKVGGGSILLPAANSPAASAPLIQATPAAVDAGQMVLAADGKHIVDSYICVFKAGAVGRGQEHAEANRAANAASGQVGHVYQHALQGFSVHASAQAVAQMRRNNARIDYCEQDAVATIIDPISAQARPGGGGTTQPPQTLGADITRVNGGNTTSTKTAWVIDTGIDLDHPDLNVDVARSKNFVSRETSPDDLNGHGSHVAGTIGAKYNTIGSVGVSPGNLLVAIRVLDRRGSGSYSDVIAGVDWVAGNADSGDVANMSLGGPVSVSLDTAVKNAAAKGIKFALAAGNETDDADNHSPARADGPNIYTVSAVNSSDVFASFSNFGAHVDYAEPGVSIYSTWKDAGYNTISGTSMASPHMAGILLFGTPATSGFAINDPDGNPDPIGSK